MGNWVKKIRNQKGFTMVEGILSSMVLAIGLIGGILILENASAGTLHADFTTIATESANEKLEEIMMDEENDGYATLSNANYPEESLTEPYEFNRSVTITEVSTSDLSTAEENSGLKRVDVSVCWLDCSDNHTVTVSTLIADY